MTDVGIPWQKPYVESSVFISWVRGELEGDRGLISTDVLNKAEAGNYQIITSYLTIAEVFKKKGTTRLTDEENGKLLRFFESPFITFVEVERIVAEDANKLCRRYHDAKLAPCDAIHVASAIPLVPKLELTPFNPLVI